MDKNRRRIDNPVRIRDGTATVCVETPHKTNVSHWEQILRRQCRAFMIHKSGDLLKRLRLCTLEYGGIGKLLCKKPVAAVFRDYRSFLFCRAKFIVPFSPLSRCFFTVHCT